MHLQLRFKHTHIFYCKKIITPIMGQAPKFLHITQLAKLKKKKKNHSKSSTHNPTSQILKKITAKTNHGSSSKISYA